MSLNLAWKMASSSHQFRKKSHEHRFTFNAKLQSTVYVYVCEVERVYAMIPEYQALLWWAQLQLDEGLKAWYTREKFIKIADRSEFGWAIVNFYLRDPLALDSEDKKDLGRAKKEARKEVKRQPSKCWVGSSQPASAKKQSLSL